MAMMKISASFPPWGGHLWFWEVMNYYRTQFCNSKHLISYLSPESALFCSLRIGFYIEDLENQGIEFTISL